MTENEDDPMFRLMRTWHEGARNLTMVVSFRHVAEVGLKSLSNQPFNDISDSHFSALHEMQSVFYRTARMADQCLEELNNINQIRSVEGRIRAFKKLNQDSMREKFKKIPGPTREEYIAECRMAVDAATLIFFHSILDGLIFDYCRLFAINRPHSWAQFVEKKQLSLKDVKNSNYEELLKRKIHIYLNSLERESLLKKIEKIFSASEMSEPFIGSQPEYRYDRKRIEIFDKCRHEVIHGQLINQTLPVSDEDLNYYHNTAMYFSEMVLVHLEMMKRNI